MCLTMRPSPSWFLLLPTTVRIEMECSSTKEALVSPAHNALKQETFSRSLAYSGCSLLAPFETRHSAFLQTLSALVLGSPWPPALLL